MKVLYGEGYAHHTGPEPCGVDREVGGEASAGGGIGQPLSRERQVIPGADDVPVSEGETDRRNPEREDGPARRPPDQVRGLACAQAPCAGTGRSLVHPGALRAGRIAPGRRGAVAGDERAGEVTLRHSSRETDERSRATGRGAGGAKGGDQGECGPAKHAPGAGPGERVTGAGSHTASRKTALRRQTPKEEPYARIGTYGSVRGALSNGRPYRDNSAERDSSFWPKSKCLSGTYVTAIRRLQGRRPTRTGN